MQKQTYLKAGIVLVVVLSLFLVVGIAAAQQGAGNAGDCPFGGQGPMMYGQGMMHGMGMMGHMRGGMMGGYGVMMQQGQGTCPFAGQGPMQNGQGMMGGAWRCGEPGACFALPSAAETPTEEAAQ